MLLLLLNLAVIWCLLVLYFTVRPDQVGALILYADDLEKDLTSIYRRLEDNLLQRHDTERDLDELMRQKRLLSWKLYALIVLLAFIHFPFAVARFLLGLFSKKQ